MSDTIFADKSDKKQAEPLFNVPLIVFFLLGLLWLVYAAQLILGEEFTVWSVYAFSFIPARWGGGEPIPQLPGSAFWSLLTYAFLHADWKHLILNSFWLVIFGTIVARVVSTWQFLLLSVFTAVAGALGTLIVHWGQLIFLIGASGMVSGMTAAAIPIMYGTSRMNQPSGQSLSEALSMRALFSNPRAMMFLLIWLGLQLMTGTSSLLTNTAFLQERPIAWEAHIGGFIAGLLVFFIMRRMVTLSK